LSLDERPDELDRIRRIIAHSGLRAGTLATSVRLLEADAERVLGSALRVAAVLGFERVRVFSGDSDGAVDDAVVQAAEVVRSCIAEAKELGVVIALETHHLFSSARTVAAVAQQVEDPSFGVVWDVMHTHAA